MKQYEWHFHINEMTLDNKKRCVVTLLESIDDKIFLNRLIQFLDMSTNHPTASGYIDLFGEYD